ncbi:M48 family metallopeptidase [Patescibacteria group bacterium]|nr:M48 family metallopeptidase [Patescibacteria group bacterium]
MSFSPPYKCNILTSKRKTVSISIEKNGTVTIRAPYRINGRHLDDILAAKKEWILRKIENMKTREEKASKMARNLNENDLKELKNKARVTLERKTFEIAQKYNFSYGKIRLSSARRRWGSCSSKNNLSFNWKIIFAPDTVIDYLVAHEIAHTIHKNHQKSFWTLVEELHPDHKKSRKWLKENAHIIDI